jgi:hypothetical protein
MDEVERSTTAGMQEVEQCMEQLPRMPEPRATHDSRDGGDRTASGTAVEGAVAEGGGVDKERRIEITFIADYLVT